MKVSDNLLAVLVILTVAVSIAGTIALLSKIPGRPLSITGMAQSSQSGTTQVTLQSEASIRLIVNTVNFGTIAHGEYNDTYTDRQPGPFVLENNGSQRINVSVWQDEADKLWSDYGSGSCPTCFKYNVTKNDTVTWASAADWTNMPNQTAAWNDVSGNLVKNMTQGAGAQRINIELNISVPTNEPAGAKSGIVRFYAVLGEGT